MATINDVKMTVQTGATTMEKAKTVNSIESLLKSANIKQKFEDMLGKKAAGFMSSVMSITNQSKMLKTADPMSIISAAAIAASLDLPINPSLGFAYIVPYGNRAQFQMGWKGFVQLAMRTGQYKTINVTEVYEGELIKHNRMTGTMEFDQAGKKSDKVVGYVAYFQLLNGFEKYCYMTEEAVTRHGKRYSKNYSGLWTTDHQAMACKTVLKMLLSKFGILSIEMQRALETDQAAIKEDGTPDYIYNNDAIDVDFDVTADTLETPKTSTAEDAFKQQ